MRKRHLRLVDSRCQKNEEIRLSAAYWGKFKDFFECILLSKNEKIYIIKDILIKLYRDYEKSTGIIDIPYFVRAEIRMSKIIRDKKVDYYYTKLKKFKNCNF